MPQVYRKATKKGFEFTVMTVGARRPPPCPTLTMHAGEAGLGKTTLIKTLFLQEGGAAESDSSEYAPGAVAAAAARVPKTVRITPHTLHLTEHGVNLTLTLVDTPGFSDAVDNTGVWEPIVKYLDQQYMAYLNDESKVNRKNIDDRRVHACLYFINPAGRGLVPGVSPPRLTAPRLKQLDIDAMRALHGKVNIIPVIAKADTLTQPELKQLKAKVPSLHRSTCTDRCSCCAKSRTTASTSSGR